jgi:hypothetical protein
MSMSDQEGIENLDHIIRMYDLGSLKEEENLEDSIQE